MSKLFLRPFSSQLLFISLFSMNYSFSQTLNSISYEVWKNNQHEMLYREVMHYDSLGFLDTMFTDSYDINNSWTQNNRDFYLYDQNGNLVSKTNQWFNNNSWENVQAFEYTYSSQGLLDSVVEFHYSNGFWIKSKRIAYLYNGSSQRIQELRSSWDLQQSDWNNSLKITSIYFNNLKSIDSIESWSHMINAWFLAGRDTISYHSSTQLIHRIDNQNYDDSLNIWKDRARLEYLYNSDGNQIQLMGLKYDSGNWIPWAKDSSAYDTTTLFRTYGLGYSQFDSTWQYHGRHTYYYGTETVGITEPEVIVANIYPNPTNGNLVIQTNTLHDNIQINVFDLNGRFVYGRKYLNTDNLLLNISHLSPSAYIIEIVADGLRVREKIMKQ